MTEATIAAHDGSGSRIWRFVGIAMTALLALAILASAARAFLDPTALALGMGLPLAAGAHDPFVGVYGIRSFALSLIALVLIWRGDLKALQVFVLVAALIPLGDAILVAGEGAPVLKVARHLGFVAFLLLDFAALRAARP